MKYIREDIDHFFDYDLYVPRRTIYMGSVAGDGVDESGTDFQMAERIIKGLTVLEAKNTDPITIKMNNVGGDEYHGMAIYDAIRACVSRVIIEAYGHAMSMGSWILQAGDVRVMAPRATMLLHYGTWGVHDHWRHHEAHHREGERLRKAMVGCLLGRIREKHPKFSAAQLNKMLETETFLTASEVVDMGLADRILL